MSAQVTETAPLLPQNSVRRGGWSPHSRWMIPVTLLAALARGVTIAARIQIVTRISCDALHPVNHATLSLSTPDGGSTLSPRIPNMCFTDPEVQASAARLQTALLVLLGVLTALTAGRWGEWGDRVGRNKVMGIALLGLTLAEFTYGLASIPHSHIIRHGHKLLLLAPIFEGGLGSWPTLQANINAYLSDIVAHDSTAKLFARFMGILYFGFALGPSVASIILRQSVKKDLTPLFIFSSSLYALSLFFVTTIVPESLHFTDKPSTHNPNIGQQNTERTPVTSIPSPLRRLVAPLAALRPRRVGAMHKDYTLTIIGAAYLIYFVSLALYSLKYLYAEHVFSWDAEHLGYYISFMGITRVIALLILLPLSTHLFRPRPPRRGIPVSPRRELNFQLRVVRFSVFLDFLSHTLVVLSPSASQTSFVLNTTLTSLGTVSIPSFSSTVLGYVRYREVQAELEDRQEDAGVLFGALAVLQSLGQTIVGPLLFGLVYSKTVSEYPKGIFIVASLLAGITLVLMCVARPRKRVILVGSRPGLDPHRRGRSGLTKSIARTV